MLILDGAFDISTSGGRMPLPNVYPPLGPQEDDDSANVPSKDDEPSVGAQEYAFDSVKVPLAENMFWVSFFTFVIFDLFILEKKILLDCFFFGILCGLIDLVHRYFIRSF